MRVTLTLLLSLLSLCLSAQSQPGGYTQNWSNYPAGEFGPTVINFDHTGIVPISQVAPVGEHPRIYFNQSDSAAIKNRLDNTLSGQEVLKQLHAYTTLLHLGYSNGGMYQHNSSYGYDTFNNKRIDNPGKWDSHQIYYKLKNYDPTALDDAGQASGVIDNKRRYLLSSVMALEALECYFYYGNTDPDTGLDYATRASDLAKAMTYWATLVLNDANLTSSNYHHFGGIHLAYCYDLNYNFMTTGQQDTVRMALAQTVISTPRYGLNTEHYATTSNWAGLNSFELLTNFAIEGETGYNPTLTEEYMRAYRNFLTYGWYKSGVPYEGMGKNYQFVTSLIAAAKRGYGLLGHPHVKTYGKNFMPATLSPYGHSYTGTDVWGGSGWDSEIGGYKFNLSDILGLRYAFQNDADIDFMWRNHIEKWYRLNSTGYVYQQFEPATSGYHNYLLQAAIFCQDYTPGNWNTQNATIQDSLGFLGPERGLAVLKSGHDEDDLALHFHCRQDMGGHTHGDRNSFAMSALGRIWVRYTYGSHFQETEYHSCLLVNDLGVPIADPDGRKARMPGKLVNYEDTGDAVQVCGDATYAYTWEWHWQSRPPTQDHSWLNTNGWSAVTEVWNDFRYEQGTEAYHNIPFYNYAHWNNAGNLERMVKRAYNPMDYVYRTALLAREPQPYVVIADDVRKDANINNFKWLMQIANDLFVSETIVSGDLCDFRNDLIFSESSGNNRKLLVRVLESRGTSQAYHETITPGINGNAPITRVVLESDAVEPEFKVLLFPFTDGDALPVTSWNANKDSLTITLNGRTNQILFDESQDHTQLDFVAQANVDECGKALCASVDLDIRFDGFPFQTSWDITDANGNVVASSGGTYSGQSGNATLNLTPACLPDGCYDLTFYDSVNNGMCPFQSTATSAGTFVTPGTLITPGSVVATLGSVVTPGLCGNYQLYDATGTLLVSGGGGFGAAETTNFCLSNGIAQRMSGAGFVFDNKTKINASLLNVYPTLASEFLNVHYAANEDIQINIIDINGRILQQHSRDKHADPTFTLSVTDIPTGIHFIQIITANGVVITEKFIKKA